MKFSLSGNCYNRYSIFLVLDIFDHSFLNGWIRIRQSGNSVTEFFAHCIGDFQISFETKLSPTEYRDGFIELDFTLNDYPLDSILRTVSKALALPNTILKDFRYEPLLFNKSIKYPLITFARTNLFADEDYDETARQVFLSIKLALINNHAFSLIRLGDGEGRLLGFPNYFNLYEVVEECIGYQYGVKVFKLLSEKFAQDSIYCGILLLKDNLFEACDSADYVCAPTQSWLMGPVNDEVLNVYSASAYAAIFKMKYTQFSSADTYIFFRFYELGFFDDIFKEAKHVSAISHTNPTEILRSRFGLQLDRHYAIPGHQTFMSSEVPQFPNFYVDVINSLEVLGDRHLFLISAGYLGKFYCHIVKKMGGVAIDIGSIFDAWTGKGRANAITEEKYRL